MTKSPTRPNPPGPPVDPVTYTPPIVTVNGREYPLRRLGLQDVLLAGKIVQAALRRLAATDPSIRDGITFAAIATTALIEEEETVTRFLANLLNVTPEQMSDPDLFPVDALFDVIEALEEHEDLRAFLARSSRLGQRLAPAAEQTLTPKTR